MLVKVNAVELHLDRHVDTGVCLHAGTGIHICPSDVHRYQYHNACRNRLFLPSEDMTVDKQADVSSLWYLRYGMFILQSGVIIAWGTGALLSSVKILSRNNATIYII